VSTEATESTDSTTTESTITVSTAVESTLESAEPLPPQDANATIERIAKTFFIIVFCFVFFFKLIDYKYIKILSFSQILVIIFAESIGFEPMGQFPDHGLANRSFNRSGNSPTVQIY